MYVSNLFLLCISRTSVAVQRWNTTRTGIVCRPFTRKCCPTICIQKHTVAVIRICQDLQNKQKIKETDDRWTMNEEQIIKNVSKQISILTSFLRFLWGNSESIWENSLFITNLKYLLGTTWIYTCDGLHIPLWGGKGLKERKIVKIIRFSKQILWWTIVLTGQRIGGSTLFVSAMVDRMCKLW